MIRLPLKDKSYVHFLTVLLGALLALAIGADAQTGRPSHLPTGTDDVVFAISFSPDGNTLAIARGAREPAQRFGRIELWDTKTGMLRHVIKGFDGPVGSISFSPDGKTLVSASREYRARRIQEKTRTWLTLAFAELKWWDVQTGELKRKVTLPHEYNLSARATYSPDSRNLAVIESHAERGFYQASPSLGAPGVERSRPLFTMPLFFESDLQLVDAQTGGVTFKLDKGRSGTAVFSPDGVLLANQNGKDIRIWNAQTGHEERRLKGFKGAPNAIAFSPDGQSLAIAATKYYHEEEGNLIKLIGSSEVQIFDVRTWKMMLQLQDVGMVNSLAFEPGGRILLIGGLIHEQDGALPGVKLWDLQAGKAATFHTGGEDFSRAVDSLAISNGGLLAFTSGPEIVQVLDTRGWKIKYTFDANSDADNQRPTSRFLLSLNRVIAVAFSRDGKTLSGVIEGSGTKLWDSRTGEVKKQLRSPEGAASIAAISSNGESIAEAGDDATLRLWNTVSESKAVIGAPGSESISALALSSDGQLIAIGNGKELMLASAGSGEKLREFPGQESTINCLVFSNDNQILASADETGIKVRDLTSGQIRNTFSTVSKVTALRFAPGDRVLVSASEDGSVSLWDLRTGVLSSQLKKHTAAVNAIAFSTTGDLMATGGDDRTVIIWETATGKAKRTLKGHDLTVTSLAFSPDASLLACGSGNAAVVLWDVRDGKLNRVLR